MKFKAKKFIELRFPAPKGGNMLVKNRLNLHATVERLERSRAYATLATSTFFPFCTWRSSCANIFHNVHHLSNGSIKVETTAEEETLFFRCAANKNKRE